MKEKILEAKMLSKTFSTQGNQHHVLRNLNVEIYKGDFTVIMGSSGSGKSTLMYALSCMDKPTLGDIYVDETKINDLKEDELAILRRDNFGFVFQQVYLIDSMSILDNVLSSGYLKKGNRKEIVEKAKKLLKRVGIEEKLFDKFPAQISGGEAQRVGIVRALINDPKIVFADEPTGALNSHAAKSVLDEFTKINNEGQTLVLVTHDISTARRANRILYLKDGVIVGELNLSNYESGDIERHDKVSAFLKEMGW